MKTPSTGNHYLRVAKKAGSGANVKKTGVFPTKGPSKDPHKTLRDYSLAQSTLKSV